MPYGGYYNEEPSEIGESIAQRGIDAVKTVVEGAIPDSLLIIFDKIGDFLQGVNIAFLNLYVILLFVLYLALIFGVMWGIIKVIPFYQKFQRTIAKWLKQSSLS